MKKLLFMLCLVIAFASCKGVGYKSPHEKRNLTVINTTDNNIDIIVKTRYNSVEHFNGTLNAGQSISLYNVPLCILIPEQAYDWRVLKTDSHSNAPVWRIRDLTDDEKIKTTIINHITYKENTDVSYKITLTGKIKNEVNDHRFSKEIAGVLATVPVSQPVEADVFLYAKEYDFSLADEKLYYKKKPDGTFDETMQYPALQRNPVDTPPRWVDDSKRPLFFTIEYNKEAKTITVKPDPVE